VELVIQILLVCGALDLAVGGALLALVWVQHRRQCEAAERDGLPVPSPATGQFVFLGAVVGVGFTTMCAALWFLTNG
jgi:hypothetical protein